MKKFNRYIAWILVIIMLASASACSDEKTAAGTSQSASQTVSSDEDQTQDSPEDEAIEDSEEEDQAQDSSEGSKPSKNSSKKSSSKKSSSKKSSSKKSSSKKSSSKGSSQSSSKNSDKSSSVPQLSGPSGIEITPDVEVEKLWTGKAAEKIALGGGTKEYPFIIRSPSELAYAVSSGGGGYYYQLATDIYLNDVSDPDWADNKDNKAWYNTEFEGHIDGAGHCVYGVWYPDSKRPKYGGLVAQFKSGSIKNLGVRYSKIYAQSYAGGIVGIASTTAQKTIESCFADETVYVAYTIDSTNGVGGILGYASGGGGTLEKPTLIIKNCYSKAKLSGYDEGYRLNGIIGTSWDCGYTMENCYSVGYPAYRGNSKRSASTLIDSGADPEKVYKNIYNNVRGAENFEVATKLETNEMNGSAAKSAMKGFNFEKVWETVSGGTPKLKIFEDIDGKNIKTPDAPSIQVINKMFESGSGTKEDPYIVGNTTQLKYVLTGSSANIYYKMSRDIYVNDTTKANWKDKSPEKWPTNLTFSGHFDGDGHSVYGLYLNEIPAEGDIINGAAGLFPKVSLTATIRNVNLKNSYISGKAYVGGIVGYVNGNSTTEKYAVVTGCTVDETVTLAGQTVGGILGGGAGGAAISYCAFTGTIKEFTGGSNRGNGIVGDIWTKNYKLAQCFTVGYTVYRGSITPTSLAAVYSTENQKGILKPSGENLYGSSAKAAMPELDWSIWKVKEDKYPTPGKVSESKDYEF